MFDRYHLLRNCSTDKSIKSRRGDADQDDGLTLFGLDVDRDRVLCKTQPKAAMLNNNSAVHCG